MVRDLPIAVLRSLSQIAFSERTGSGVLILAAITVMAPWSAVGAIIGALSGTLSGMALSRSPKASWRQGLDGVNPAILGLIWGGVLSRGDPKAALFVFALLGCIALEHPMRSLALRWKMPVLSLPALLAGWASSITFQIFDDNLWLCFASMPFGIWSSVTAIVLVAAVVFQQDRGAAIVSAFYTAISALAAGWLTGEIVGPASLWAFSVAPTVMGICLLIPTARKQLWPLPLLTSIVAILVWTFLGLSQPIGYAPPFMLPLIVSMWAAYFAVRSYAGELATNPLMAEAVRALATAKAQGRKIVALTGAGISMPSGIPDYVSSTWLDPNIPVEEYSYSRFKVSRAARTAYWDACNRFRGLATEAKPNAAHRAMNDMMEMGWLSGIVTQNVDGLHGRKNTFEIHGDISAVRCIDCGATTPWPERATWQDKDLTCEHCGGHLKPGVVAIGEDTDQVIWEEAREIVEGCGVLLVIATRMTMSTVAILLSLAKQADARIIFITKGDIYQTVLESDIVMPFAAEYTIPTLSRLLGISPSSIEGDNSLKPPTRIHQ